MQSDSIRILLLDDCEDDAVRLLNAVRNGGYDPSYRIVRTPSDFAEALEREPWDLVLGDHGLAECDSIAALRILRERVPTLPFIAVAESIDEATAVEVMTAGATDYVLRRNLARLVPAIRRELRDARDRRARDETEAALRESEERFRCLSVSSPVGVFLADTDGECIYVNPRCRDILGGTMGRLIGRGWLTAIHPADRDPVWTEFSSVAGENREYSREFRLLPPGGGVVWVRFRSAPMLSDQRELIGHVGTMEDITQRRSAEQRVAMQYATTRVLGEAASWEEAAPRLMRAVCDTLGLRLAERWRIDRETERMLLDSAFFSAESGHGGLAEISERSTVERGEGLVGAAWKAGSLEWISDASREVASPYCAPNLRGVLAVPVRQGQETIEVLVFASGETLELGGELLTVMAGLANQVSQFLERKRLQTEFLQAQKMEVVGMLAGGVAHDFNNLLLVVMGYSDLMLQRLKPGDALYSDLEEIRKAGQRAASLTRQLLAFTRKGDSERQLVNLNDVIGETLKMLRRVLGQSYELLTDLDPNLRFISADPGQIDQVLMNMAVNARDAMPNGGRLTISTRNTTVDSESNSHSLPSGDYALMTIADTGTGMGDEVKARIFDPFFTTKAKGKGTGLGLATCLSIVHESGGVLDVESAPGKGTSFLIFLPCVEAPEPAAATAMEDEGESLFAGRGERILVVDDEPALRDLTALVLTDAGYSVQQAGNGQEAISALAQSPGEKLDLLLTDVDMPQMNGFELADRIAALHPQAKIVFCSGHASDAVARKSERPGASVVVTKPYTPQALVRTVRQTLDGTE